MEYLSRIHPIIIHFPIALFFAYFILELAGVIFKKENLHSSAFIILVLAVLFSLFAVVTGNQALEQLRFILKGKSKEYIELIQTHEQSATITLWYFLLFIILRMWLVLKKIFDLKWKIIFLILGAIGCYLTIRTGILGGQLVYDYGIGTKIFIR